MMKKMLLTVLMGAATLALQAQNTFQLGGDISMLPQYESAATPYYNSGNTKIPNVLNYMKSTVKMNTMRVRLFVTPDPTDRAGAVQDLEYVKNLGKRIKAAGLDFMVDFHYSDTWADPANQTIPSTWTNTADAVLIDSMYSYTKRCLEYLVENEATPDFVQIGNEISYGMLWRSNSDKCTTSSPNSTWVRLAKFLNSAAKAVREVTPQAKIVLHIERAGNASTTRSFYQKMASNNVDYDVIGLSYYPFWHGTLATLGNTLNTLATAFPGKPVQIVETAYYYQYFPTSDSEYTNTTGTWADTPAGQAAFIEDLCAELAQHDNVTGLYYWFPEENGSGKTKTVLSPWVNRGLWHNDTGKINPALLKLKDFLTAKEAVSIRTVSAEGNDAPASVQAAASSAAPIYNICGQQVESMTAPDLYIQAGKKYWKQ